MKNGPKRLFRILGDDISYPVMWGLPIINHDKKGSLFIKQAGFNGTYLAVFFLVAGDPKLNLCCFQGTSVPWRPALVGGLVVGDGSPWMWHTNWDRYFLLGKCMWRFGVKTCKLGDLFYCTSFPIFFDVVPSFKGLN